MIGGTTNYQRPEKYNLTVDNELCNSGTKSLTLTLYTNPIPVVYLLPHHRRSPILRPDKVRHRLRLTLIVVRAIAAVMHIMRAMSMSMSVMAVRRPDVLELVDAAALGTALDGAVARGGQPDDDVAVGGAAGAAAVLLVAERLDDDRVLQRA